MPNDKLKRVQQGFNEYADAPINMDTIAPGLRPIGQAASQGFSELKKRLLPQEQMPMEQPDFSEPAMQDFRERQMNLPGNMPERINPEVRDQMDLLNTLSEFGELDPEQKAEQERLMKNKIVKEYLDKKGR